MRKFACLMICVALGLGAKPRMDAESERHCGIRLAKGYPGLVAAVKCPVTMADDHLCWVQPDAKLVPVVDFITLHTYPIWNKKFSAFDEPWKGDGTEGHWGLFTEDRKAKPVMQALYPKLKPTGPTSPSYDTSASEKTPTEGK
jgi:hypothetical protein